MGAPPEILVEDIEETPPASGLVSTLRHTPGWVWIVIGGIVLLVVGLLAARTAIPSRGDFKDTPL